MPRTMPRLDLELSHHAQNALGIVKAGETVRAVSVPGSQLWNEWSLPRLEALYELAFLRTFIAWEMFLEATFYRYLCGYISKLGAQTLVRGTYFHTMAAAERGVLGGNQYIAWYNPNTVLKRCQTHVVNGLHEAVFRANFHQLDCFCMVRHRIAHGQEDARKKFDAATLALSGRRYPGSRPGRFLRDWDTRSTPTVRWLETFVSEVSQIAGQIL
jgi:hypothetical protein